MKKTVNKSLSLTNWLKAIMVVGTVCVAGSLSAKAAPVPVEHTAEQSVAVIKSAHDKASYRYLTLPNKLKVLLVSDMAADKAAAALDVYVGSGNDPQNRQGLAHFLEHMLFLGTKKYPESGEYQTYISQHGGHHNAYTSFEHTNYFFDINPVDLEPALDRFAQFFIAPLFDDTYVNREKNAVHSEYKARIKNDYRRQLDVFRQLVNPDHPAAKFSVGNLDTLSDKDGQLRKDLLTFYQQHYSANRMALVVVAPQTLDRLEKMVTNRFSAIPDRNSTRLIHGQPLFLDGVLPLLVKTKPVKEMRELSVSFPLPPVDKYYREKPLGYLGHLVGHEGKGSLLWLLKQHGWAERLSAGQGFSDSSGSSFDVTVSLTPEGFKQWQQVLALVYSELTLVKKKGLQQWRQQEQQALSELSFRFKEREEPVHVVSRLASNLQRYPAKDVLRGPYQIDVYDESLLKKLLQYIKPDNALVVVTAPEVTTDKITKLYDVPYAIPPLTYSKSPVLFDDQRLTLPKKNPFVPNNLALGYTDKKAVPQLPQLLNKPASGKAGNVLWHYHDQFYGVPKAQLYVAVKTPAVNGLKAAAMTDLYLRAVEETLNETSYEATLAGLRYGINRRPDGIGFMISGFSDKLPLLVQSVVSGLLAPDLSPELLARLKQELIRHWMNSTKDTPYMQLMRESSVMLKNTSWAPKRLAETLKGVDRAAVLAFAKTLFDGASLEVLVSGNVDQQGALEINNQLVKHLASKTPVDWLSRGVTQIPVGKKVKVSVSTDYKDAAILRYYQGRDDSVAETARFLLLRQIIKSPFFDELRTEQQLGYIVAAVSQSYDRVPGFGLLAQSPNAPVRRLEQATDHFLDLFSKQLQQMSESEFERHRKAILVGLLEKPKNLAEQSGRYWGSIDLRDYSFDRRKKLIEAVKNLTLPQLREAYQQVVMDAGHSIQFDTRRSQAFISGLDAGGSLKEFTLPDTKM